MNIRPGRLFQVGAVALTIGFGVSGVVPAAYASVQPASAVPADSQDNFINSVAPMAQQMNLQYDIPASVAIGQSADESNWGQSGLSANYDNYFGFKCTSATDPGPIATGCQWLNDSTGGAYYRVYSSVFDSFADYARLLTTDSAYADALPYRNNPNEFIQHVGPTYSTNSGYASQVIALMQQYDLYRFDTGSQESIAPSSSQVVYEANTQTTEAFARGQDGRLDHTYLTSAGWQPWSTIGPDSLFQGDPEAIYEPNTQTTEVFARDVNDHLIHTYLTSSGWQPWSVIGTEVIASDPVAVYEANTQTVDVFARGQDGRLDHTYLTSAGWQSWSTIGLDSLFQGNPVPVYEPNTQTADVFAGDVNDHLIHTYLSSAGWQPWSVLGTEVISPYGQ